MGMSREEGHFSKCTNYSSDEMAFWHSLKWAIVKEENHLFSFHFGIVNEYSFRRIVYGDSQNPLLYSFNVTGMKMILQNTRQYELDYNLYSS